MIKKTRVIAGLLLMISLLLITPLKTEAESTAIRVVKDARTLYYGVEKKMQRNKLKILTSSGCKDYYYRNKLVMTRVYKVSGNYCSPKKCKCEFYYDSKYRPRFIFAWKKTKGRVKEYRAYFGTNGKCYRYIGPNGKVHTYKKGRNRSNMPVMAYEMFFRAQRNLHFLGYL